MTSRTETVPRWLIGLVIVVAGALGYVGAVAVSTAATLTTHQDAQKTQFEDIKDRLVRIEGKVDALGE